MYRQQVLEMRLGICLIHIHSRKKKTLGIMLCTFCGVRYSTHLQRRNERKATRTTISIKR